MNHRAESSSDVYSLGLCLYDVLTGQQSTRSGSGDELARLASVVPAIDADLEAIVHRAIETRPERRYANGSALSLDLRAWLDGRPIEARRLTPLERARRWIRRHAEGVVHFGTRAAGFLLLGALSMAGWKQWASWKRIVVAAEEARLGAGFEPGQLLAPDGDDAGGAHHEVAPAGQRMRAQEGDDLRRLAEAHLVGEQAVATGRAKVVHPLDATALVGPQEIRQGRRLSRRAEHALAPLRQLGAKADLETVLVEERKDQIGRERAVAEIVEVAPPGGQALPFLGRDGHDAEIGDEQRRAPVLEQEGGLLVGEQLLARAEDPTQVQAGAVAALGHGLDLEVAGALLQVPDARIELEGELLGEFGEERRTLTPIDEIPLVMKNAVLAIEDARFYSHGGVDYLGVIRAGLANVGRAKSQGASTITMQVARNVYLSAEKSYTRKIYEILLTFKLEHLLTKDQILEIYMNQIFLGNRAYGFAAASEAYFGRPLKDITVAEAAMLAALGTALGTPFANAQALTDHLLTQKSYAPTHESAAVILMGNATCRARAAQVLNALCEVLRDPANANTPLFTRIEADSTADMHVFRFVPA